MKRSYILLCGLVISSVLSSNVMAAEIIYPKSNNVTINADSTFFVGNEAPDKALTINSEPVKVHPSGGFFLPVKLEVGENVFRIDNSCDKPLVYTVTRYKSASYDVLVEEILYKQPVVYLTSKEGVPLRSTPYDYGINRLQHLEKGVLLKVIGEFGSFYKVQLARDDYAWIDKSNVLKSDIDSYNIAKIQGFIYNEEADKRVFTVKLNKKVPYVLSESNGLDLVVYNVEGYPENKYEFHINKLGKMFGYKSYYKNNDELVIEVKKYPSVDKKCPLSGLNITLDAGHGGLESGAVGCLGNKEKDVNLSIVMKLKDVLESSGANVFLAREDDSDVSLSERVEFSKSKNSDIFISVHNNALPDSQAFSSRSGTSVYYFYPQSREVGEKVLDSLVNELGLNNDKLRRESFAVVRNTESPAILIELGYMINPDDNAKIIDDEFQQKAAEAIKQGLENYLNDL